MNRRAFLALAAAATRLRPTTISLAQSPKPVRFIAFGDSGTGDEQQAALARGMATQEFEFALMLGDNIYPDGNKADVAAKFGRPYAELLKRGVRFYASLGNHDVKAGREWEINYPNFNMGGHHYYSFVQGDKLVEFFALDSNYFDATQAQWLERGLAASTARWKIAFFHHPLYSSGSTHGSTLSLRAKLEPLLVKHGVAVVLSGHDHIYERLKPQKSVQYFVSGAGGKLRRGDLRDNSPLTAYGNDEVSSYMLFEATAERLSFKALDASGRTLDSGEILPLPAMRPAAAAAGVK
jgi:hypothetical protein